MKTTSSKLTWGVMIFVALLVPVMTWWASFRYYNGRREAESRQQLARLQEIQEKYADSVKNNELLRAAIRNEHKRRALFQGINAGTMEFVGEPKQRSAWNWPTDPDHVWQDQRRRAGEMLIRLDATNQPPARTAPFRRRVPSR